MATGGIQVMCYALWVSRFAFAQNAKRVNAQTGNAQTWIPPVVQ